MNTTPRDQVASAFIKELRLRHRDDALYWMILLTRIDGDSTGALRLLKMFLIEDCLSTDTLILAVNINEEQLNRNDIENLASRLFDIAVSPDTPRFWETAAGREAERSYWRIHDQVDADLNANTLKSIPEYAIDIHTAQGRASHNPPHQFSGTREGRLSMCDAFERSGKLDPEA